MSERRRQMMGTASGGTSKSLWNGFEEVNFSDLEALGNKYYIWRGTITWQSMGFTITNPIIVFNISNNEIMTYPFITGYSTAVFWAYYSETGNNVGTVSLGASSGYLVQYMQNMIKDITTDISSVYGVSTIAKGASGYFSPLPSLSDLKYINSSTTVS